MTFATDAATRGWLRIYTWRRMNRNIAVVTDCRHLGAHLNGTEGIWYGETLPSRMLQVANETGRLNRIKAPSVKKASLLRAKKMPEGMYGW